MLLCVYIYIYTHIILNLTKFKYSTLHCITLYYIISQYSRLYGLALRLRRHAAVARDLGAPQLDPTPVTISNKSELDSLNLLNKHKSELIHCNLNVSNSSNMISGGGVSLCGPCDLRPLARARGAPAGADQVVVHADLGGRRSHTRNQHLRNRRGFSVAFSNG